MTDDVIKHHMITTEVDCQKKHYKYQRMRFASHLLDRFFQ